MMEKVKNLFKILAHKHLLVGHEEYEPHFAYLNDEKDMLLPANMAYPFVLFGHGGFEVLDGGEMRRWSLLLSVQTHVTDTGDDREKNRALNLCASILDDLLVRATSLPMKMKEPWTRGFELDGAHGTAIENEDDALWGWMIEFSVVLPWCKDIPKDRWKDYDYLDNA